MGGGAVSAADSQPAAPVQPGHCSPPCGSCPLGSATATRCGCSSEPRPPLASLALIPGQAAGPALITGLITWFVPAARADMTPQRDGDDFASFQRIRACKIAGRPNQDQSRGMLTSRSVPSSNLIPVM